VYNFSLVSNNGRQSIHMRAALQGMGCL